MSSVTPVIVGIDGSHASVEAAHIAADEAPARLRVRHGIDPAIALTVDSHTAQLVVVGSNSHRTAAASVAHALVHRAACPVAVVPTIVHSGRYLEPSAQAV